MAVLVISCALAALLGFAAQRASICNVRAVAEVIASRTGYMLASIGKSVLWVVVVTVPFLWLMPAAAAALGGWRLSWISLLGGLLFGIGAAVNGACAFSTLARLADGQLAMLGTLSGFLLGVVGFELLASAGLLFAPPAGMPLVGSALAAGGAMAAVALILWGAYEASRLWRTRDAPTRLRHLAVAAQYRLSTAAMLIGLANGVLYLVDGAWGYTGTLQQSVEGWLQIRMWPHSAQWVLFGAMFAGMLLSTWQRRSLRIVRAPVGMWLRTLSGGVRSSAGAGRQRRAHPLRHPEPLAARGADLSGHGARHCGRAGRHAAVLRHRDADQMQRRRLPARARRIRLAMNAMQSTLNPAIHPCGSRRRSYRFPAISAAREPGEGVAQWLP